jgi:hypothetical protein
MLYLRFTLLRPALYSVHNASQNKIAEVQIQPNGPHKVTPVRRLTPSERQSIAAFKGNFLC